MDAFAFLESPCTTEVITEMIDAAELRQDAILAAVDLYAEDPRHKNVVRPEFAPLPPREAPEPVENTATQRALSTANWLAKVWAQWLDAEDERCRRTAKPRTGATPWMMPPELNSPEIALLPDNLADKLRPQRVR